MDFRVDFHVSDQTFKPDFDKVNNVSDGGFERGYDAGYAKGETAGYTKGYGEGETAGYNQGNSDGYETGYAKGNSDGYVEGYETGYAEGVGGIYFTPYGVGYTADMVFDCKQIVAGAWWGADNLKSLELTEWNPRSAVDLKVVGNTLTDVFRSTSLETLLLPKLQYTGHYWARGATGLKTVQLGSVGFPVDGGMAGYTFSLCQQKDFTITVYTVATTLEEAKAIFPTAPWSAINATVIYRNSTTGEVITE